MSTKKATKRALLTSILAICMCLVMLIGSTFAWFTDTASTGVNKIVSGNLKVDIIGADSKAHIDTLNFTKATGAEEGEQLLWEPGVRYLTEGFKIANNGNLALKWKAEINKDNIVDGKVEGSTIAKNGMSLLNVIDFYVVESTDENATAVAIEDFVGKLGKTETSGVYYIKGVMQTTAGNDYQDLTLDGITITVYATQDTVENDSFNNQYDKDAQYPQVIAAAGTDDYNNALSTVTGTNKNQTVTITVKDNLDNVGGIKTSASNNLTVDLNEKTVTVLNTVGSTNTETQGAQFLKGSSVTLKNGTYTFSANNAKGLMLIQNYANLTLENVTLNADTAYAQYALSSNCGNVVIKGDTNIKAAAGKVALDIMHWENSIYEADGSHVVIDESMKGTIDGKILVYCDPGDGTGTVNDGGATLVIKGGTFKNSGLTLEQFKAFVPAGYTVTTNTDGSYTVK